MQSFASIVGFIAIVYLSLFQWSRSQNGIDSVGLSDGSMSIRDVGFVPRVDTDIV